MTAAADFQQPQDGALASRRKRPQTAHADPSSEEMSERIRRHKPKVAPPTLDANDETNLTQLAQRSNITLESKVRVCRVAPSDNDLLQEGAVFYWITAMEQDPSGEIISTSHIRFRRRPRLSPEEAKELRKLADEAIIAGGGTPISDEDLE
jgi:hypothetical protein